MSLFKTLRSWWGSTGDATVQKVDTTQIDLEVPRYPPFVKGLPAVAPERLIQSQDELLVQLARVVTVSKPLYEQHYLGVLRRFVSYCHLLPASQAHHHRGAGGLLRHSIEVGLWAAQASDKLLLDLGKTPAQRRQIEPRWQLTAFVAGLCHDVGKPAIDLVVTSHDRTKVWKPLTENLSDWTSANKISAYFLDWRVGRAKQHVVLSNLIADRIIGSETLAWIDEGGTELVVWLMESLNANPGARNPLYDLVVKSDQASVERDMKSLGVAMAGYELGVPVERHLTDIMRRLIREGVWQVNEPGARVWNIDGSIFLVWPAAGDEIASKVREDGAQGMPRTGDGVLDMLVERHLAFLRDHDDGDRFWKVAPEVLEAKFNKRVVLTCVRLKDDAMISSVPLASVPGVVTNGPNTQPVEAVHEEIPEPQAQPSCAAAEAREEEQAAEAMEEAAKPKKPRVSKPKPSGTENGGEDPHAPSEGSGVRTPAQMEIDPNTGEIFNITVTKADGSQRQLSVRKGALAGDGTSGLSSPVALKLKPKEAEFQQDDQVAQAGQGDPRALPEPTAPVKKAKRQGIDLSAPPTLQFDGAVGELLEALAEDLKNGTKSWETDARVDEEEMVHLKWPVAFSGYGLSAKAILDECSTKQWLWIDPYRPMVRVIDSLFQGEPCKAVRLNPEATYTLLHKASYKGESQGPLHKTSSAQQATKPSDPHAHEQSEGAPSQNLASGHVAAAEQGTLDLDGGPPAYLDEIPQMAMDDMPAPVAFTDLGEPDAPRQAPARAKRSLRPDTGAKQPVASATERQKGDAPVDSKPAAVPKPKAGEGSKSSQGSGGQNSKPSLAQKRSTLIAEPLQHKSPFQETKFDKFMAIVKAMDGTLTGDGWISLDRKACIDACKAQGLDLNRRDLQSFTEYASDYLNISGASVRLKTAK